MASTLSVSAAPGARKRSGHVGYTDVFHQMFVSGRDFSFPPTCGLSLFKSFSGTPGLPVAYQALSNFHFG